MLNQTVVPAQLEDKIGARQVSNQSASISSPSSEATLDGDPGVPKPAKKGRSRKKKAAAHAASYAELEQASGALHPQLPGDGDSRAGQSSPPLLADEVKACVRCGITAEGLENGKLRECSVCRSVRYCGKDCQKADWKAHQHACKPLQDAQQ